VPLRRRETCPMLLGLFLFTFLGVDTFTGTYDKYISGSRLIGRPTIWHKKKYLKKSIRSFNLKLSRYNQIINSDFIWTGECDTPWRLAVLRHKIFITSQLPVMLLFVLETPAFTWKYSNTIRRVCNLVFLKIPDT